MNLQKILDRLKEKRIEQQNTLRIIWGILRSKFNDGKRKGNEHRTTIKNKLKGD